ncbi:hypothetical protein K470DRAFT_266821 [Piedraia hortae CBS 480.64]|uniref:Uncharacterized protein n=1 Tax=Piedraia hortae CBS 480.64 TaxID=1314780 RepID=A0A6A7BQB2_9PEZI|nr:hypothetical protein K470DRAFT_266821 [Piedraia hortae CBS 480.64]
MAQTAKGMDIRTMVDCARKTSPSLIQRMSLITAGTLVDSHASKAETSVMANSSSNRQLRMTRGETSVSCGIMACVRQSAFCKTMSGLTVRAVNTAMGRVAARSSSIKALVKQVGNEADPSSVAEVAAKILAWGRAASQTSSNSICVAGRPQYRL